ncbi:MAG: serine/threonine dehydratase [Actinomycetota bacterium]
MEVTPESIEAAALRIEGLIRHTPVLEPEPGLVLKLEQTQVTGSFKARGASAFLTAHPEVKRVVAASGGNHGLAVAYSAARLGLPADIFVPSSSPSAKLSRIEETGAELHVVDGYYSAALEASRRFLEEHDAVEIHAYDDPDVVSGQGTCGREILSQIDDLEAVVVAVGGGGLMGGIASWIRDEATLVAAETPGTSALHAAREAGHPVPVQVGGVAADSLGARQVGELGFEAARRWVDESVLVDDDDVVAAQHWLWSRCRLVAEPGGATALAAFLAGAFPVPSGGKTCIVVSGANTAPGSVA